MPRRTIHEIIKNASFDVQNECRRITHLFCDKIESGLPPLREMIDISFEGMPMEFRGRSLSLNDFNETYGFDYCNNYTTDDIEKLIGYCEYILNMCAQIENNDYYPMENGHEYVIDSLQRTIRSCMDEVGQISVSKDGLIIFVERDPSALAVAEIVDKDLAFRVLEYNHHRLKGNLGRKQMLLKLFADDFESKRKQLKSITGSVESQLGELMNKFVRHDHSQTPYITTLNESQLEDIYDDIYQLYLLGNLQLDNLDRKKRITTLLGEINRK